MTYGLQLQINDFNNRIRCIKAYDFSKGVYFECDTTIHWFFEPKKITTLPLRKDLIILSEEQFYKIIDNLSLDFEDTVPNDFYKKYQIIEMLI
jgi:hypothetical protein